MNNRLQKLSDKAAVTAQLRARNRIATALEKINTAEEFAEFVANPPEEMFSDPATAKALERLMVNAHLFGRQGNIRAKDNG